MRILILLVLTSSIALAQDAAPRIEDVLADFEHQHREFTEGTVINVTASLSRPNSRINERYEFLIQEKRDGEGNYSLFADFTHHGVDPRTLRDIYGEY